MDDDDAYLNPVDDLDPFEEAGESDDDVLDIVDGEQVDTHTDALRLAQVVPASSPTHRRETEDEKVSELVLTVSDSSRKCYSVLTEKFGFSGYKGKQKEIMQAALSGADVFVLAPTGMGKSLCFQVPAIVEDNGVSIVVSPLLALMKNQVTGLRRKGIQAVSLTSETSKGEKSEIMRDLLSKYPKNRLFYTTPEKLCTQDLTRTLTTVYSNGRLSRLVIDEAHCISEWGHDFRAEYRKLGSFRQRFPGVPIMALTATATKNVQRDIIQSLKMAEDKLFAAIHPFNRSNLYYEVRYKSAPEPGNLMQDILDFVSALHQRRGRPSSGIIYCRKREMCDELSNYLRGKGLNARPYHRGISPKTLDKTLKEWEIGGTGEGGVDVVCATIAFGMGIDKSDVRYIIHYDLPKSMEGYYQETGRAGRDGLPSRCILYYSREDVLHLRKLVSSTHARRQDAASSKNGPEPSQRSFDSLGALVAFAENVSICRHVSMCRYFGEIIDTTDDDLMQTICDKMCDVCKFPDKTRQRKTNLSDEAYAAEVISRSAWNAGYEDDGEPEAQQLRQPTSAPLSVSTAVHVNQRDLGQKTLWDCLESIPLQGFKRPNSRGGDRVVFPASKKAKAEHAKDERCAKGTDSRARASMGTRVTMPPPLITRPHNSASTLRKPFKTPFKVPLEQPEHVANINNTESSVVQIQKRSVSPAPVQHARICDMDEHEHDVEIVETGFQQAPSRQVEVPDIEMELEASFSNKVQFDIRTRAFGALRKSLHRIFPLDATSLGNTITHTAWDCLVGAPTSIHGRTIVVAEAAKRLEHAIHIMSATPVGYEERVLRKQRVVELLADVEREGKKGGIRCEEGDDDAGEIMEALKSSTTWWQKQNKELS